MISEHDARLYLSIEASDIYKDNQKEITIEVPRLVQMIQKFGVDNGPIVKDLEKQVDDMQWDLSSKDDEIDNLQSEKGDLEREIIKIKQEHEKKLIDMKKNT